MAFIPVPDTVMVELLMTVEGQQIENTLYFEGTGSPDIPEMNALGASLVDWWIEHYAPLVGDDVSLNSIKLTNLTGAASPVVEITAGLPQSGSGGDFIVANQVAAVVTFLTAARGKSYRGRNYIGGLSINWVGGSYVGATAISMLETMYADLATLALADEFLWVVVSRYNNNAPRATGVTTVITGTRVNEVLGTQRRRRIGSGN